mmetsp:Transcript_79879/g.246398  ORF Transcript_79879/g.246398 Transcript_79879/m.246398 type:complete len:200 (+) Transcript_79879:117-716(+)
MENQNATMITTRGANLRWVEYRTAMLTATRRTHETATNAAHVMVRTRRLPTHMTRSRTRSVAKALRASSSRSVSSGVSPDAFAAISTACLLMQVPIITSRLQQIASRSVHGVDASCPPFVTWRTVICASISNALRRVLLEISKLSISVRKAKATKFMNASRAVFCSETTNMLQPTVNTARVNCRKPRTNASHLGPFRSA